MTAVEPPVGQDGGRVVVGVDGSSSSIRALRHGARLAEGLGLTLEAVTVWRRSGRGGDRATGPLGGAPAAIVASQDAAVASAFDGFPPARFQRTMIEGETIATLLTRSAEAEYLVLGSRAHGSIAGLVLGSVTAACSIHARCAVLICHADIAPVRATAAGRSEIVVGVDGTEASVGALRQGARFAESLRLPLLAICAWGAGISSLHDARVVLTDATLQVFGGSPPRWFRSFEREGAPEVVLGRASEHARMLVIGYGGDGTPTTSSTSVSSLIAVEARCPVVVFHVTRSPDPDALTIDRRSGIRSTSLY